MAAAISTSPSLEPACLVLKKSGFSANIFAKSELNSGIVLGQFRSERLTSALLLNEEEERPGPGPGEGPAALLHGPLEPPTVALGAIEWPFDILKGDKGWE